MGSRYKMDGSNWAIQMLGETGLGGHHRFIQSYKFFLCVQLFSVLQCFNLLNQNQHIPLSCWRGACLERRTEFIDGPVKKARGEVTHAIIFHEKNPCRLTDYFWNSMTSDIILIGPVRAGKSTIEKLLSERLRLPPGLFK